MLGWRFVASLMVIGLIGCGDGGTGAAVGNAARSSTAAEPMAAAATANAPAPRVEEGQPGYGQSLRGATTAVGNLFAPYMTQGAEPPSDMDPRPDYSAALNRAIAAWRVATVEQGVTALSEAGWICSCQDWDATRARLTIVGSDATDRGYAVETLFSADGSGSGASVRFLMIEEAGRWTVDDIIFAGNETSVRAALADETNSRGE